ncbi:MAG: N-acetylmuramoyl-L-alanine amidase [Thermoleophilaceae bacterium]
MGKASGRGPGIVSRPLRTVQAVQPGRPDLEGPRGRAEDRRSARERRAAAGRAGAAVATHSEDGPDPGSGEPGARGTSNPDWVGEADWVQYRSDRSLRGLRLQFMNVRGTATRADRARGAVRRVANTGVGVGGRARERRDRQGGRAAARDRQARRLGRQPVHAALGRRQYGEVKTAFVHHTVNANDYTRDEAPDVVLAICRYHRDSNGWNDIGYNFLVDRFGTIYEGRAGGIDQPVIGAQAQGYNAQSTGIANIGTFSSVRADPGVAQRHGPPDPVEAAAARRPNGRHHHAGQRRRDRRTAIRRDSDVALRRVIGHRDTGATSCPGEALYAQLPRLRSMVGDVEPGGLTTRDHGPGCGARRSTVTYGATAPVTGTITAGGAAPNASLPVQIQAFVGTRWRDGGHHDRPDSGRSVRLHRQALAHAQPARPLPRPERPARRELQGGAEWPCGRSCRSRGGPSALAPGSGLTLRGKVRPRRTYVWQVLQLKKGRRWAIVGRRKVKTARNGTFQSFFVPGSAGQYRFYVAALKDRTFARGVSKLYPVDGLARTRQRRRWRLTARSVRGARPSPARAPTL